MHAAPLTAGSAGHHIKRRDAAKGQWKMITISREINKFSPEYGLQFVVRGGGGEYWRDNMRDAYRLARSEVRLMRADASNPYVAAKLPWIGKAIEV